jgi:monoterpene epsilon-lactone hydrolase
MSWQLGLLNNLLRYGGRPRLARTTTPEEGARDFERAARHLFRVPPLTCHLTGQIGQTRVHKITAGPVPDDRVILYLHGGAYFAGSGATHLGLLARLSRLTGLGVIAPDYRLLQDAPFPAALDDARTVWQHLVATGIDPDKIVLGGDSAGGGLALALLAELTQASTPPAALFAFSPWTDLTMSGDSIASMGPQDVILPVHRMAEVASVYLGGAATADPRASPLFADFVAPPPVLIQVGSHEALLDDSRRMATRLRDAGGEVTLEVWAKTPHVWHLFDGYLPEARAALRTAAGFIQSSLASASR